MLELRKDVGGARVLERAPRQPRVKWFEAVHVLRMNGGRVPPGEPDSSRSDGVAERSDKDLTVVSATPLQWWNVMERLAGSA